MFSILGFLLGQRFAAAEGVEAADRQSFYGLLGGVLGNTPVGLAMTVTLARREADSTPPPVATRPGMPSVSGVSPASGKGGTPVTITGTNLNGVTAVHFGDTAASDFKPDPGGTLIKVNSPPRADGTVDVTVTTPVGVSVPTNADKFTYKGGSN
jgi:hypothetical protein